MAPWALRPPTAYISTKISCMTNRLGGRNLWALTVLCLLWERPLHPYQMLRLIRERRKDRLLDLRGGSIYNTIRQLERAHLIEPAGTGRNGRRPERTVYRLTDAGRQEAITALQEGVASATLEPSRFLAAIGFLSRLTPSQVLQALRRRAEALEAELADLSPDVSMERSLDLQRLGDLARVVLLDAEYLRTVRQAELRWTRGLIADLEAERLSWDFQDIIGRMGRSVPNAPE